jgi:hypothetical protein
VLLPVIRPISAGKEDGTADLKQAVIIELEGGLIGLIQQ